MASASLNVVEEFVSKTLEGPIQFLLSNGFYSSALVLTFSAIDTMAYLAMPAGKLDVMRSDFIDWAEKYMIFENSSQRPTAQDLYGARCGVLHGQGTACRRTREGKCRPIRFTSAQFQPRDTAYESPSKDAAHVATLELEVQQFVGAFLGGARRFLSSLCQDPRALKLASQRLGEIIGSMPSL